MWCAWKKEPVQIVPIPSIRLYDPVWGRQPQNDTPVLDQDYFSFMGKRIWSRVRHRRQLLIPSWHHAVNQPKALVPHAVLYAWWLQERPASWYRCKGIFEGIQETLGSGMCFCKLIKVAESVLLGSLCCHVLGPRSMWEGSCPIWSLSLCVSFFDLPTWEAVDIRVRRLQLHHTHSTHSLFPFCFFCPIVGQKEV